MSNVSRKIFTQSCMIYWISSCFLNSTTKCVTCEMENYVALRIDCLFFLFGNFLIFWKCKSMIYNKIFYKNYVNKNSWVQKWFLYFFQFPKIFTLWFFKWWWSNNLNNVGLPFFVKFSFQKQFLGGVPYKRCS